MTDDKRAIPDEIRQGSTHLCLCVVRRSTILMSNESSYTCKRLHLWIISRMTENIQLPNMRAGPTTLSPLVFLWFLSRSLPRLVGTLPLLGVSQHRITSIITGEPPSKRHRVGMQEITVRSVTASLSLSLSPRRLIDCPRSDHGSG